MKNITGELIMKSARGWIGTPFHHQGRQKKQGHQRGGVDCLGLLVGIAQELKLTSRSGKALGQFDVTDYGHLPDGKRLRATLDDLLLPVEVEQIAVGDVLLMRFDAEPQHLAIVTNHPQGGFGMVHALAQARKVVEHRLDAHWQSRIVKIYRVSGC